MSTISDFVSKMSVGLARTNRYSVVMTIPEVVDIEGLLPTRDVMLFCDQVQLPGLNVQTTPNRTFGEVRETPYEYNYEPLTMSFYVDSRLHVKLMFDEWIKSLQNKDRRTFRYYDEYICPQAQILVQDISDATRYQVSLYELYPKSMSAIQMDYASKDIMKLSVTFTFKYWKSVEIVQDETGNNAGLSGAFDKVVDIPGFEGFQSDLNDIVSIPSEYFSDFNSFQSNLFGNLQSDVNSYKNKINGQINGIISPITSKVNNLKSASQGIQADVGKFSSLI